MTRAARGKLIVVEPQRVYKSIIGFFFGRKIPIRLCSFLSSVNTACVVSGYANTFWHVVLFPGARVRFGVSNFAASTITR